MSNVYGGYTNNGDATENKVKIIDSTVGDLVGSDYGVYGGFVGDTGSATQNEVHIDGGTVNGSVYGGRVGVGGDGNGNATDGNRKPHPNPLRRKGSYLQSAGAEGNEHPER